MGFLAPRPVSALRRSPFRRALRDFHNFNQDSL